MGKNGAGHNDKLDLFKCIAIYGVVLAHIPLPGQFGRALCALAKFSVVLFFLTAGYFSCGRSSAVLARRTVKTGALLAVSAAGLLVLGCALSVHSGAGTALQYLQGRLDPFYWKDFLLYQLLPLPYSWPMWYLASQLMVYLLWTVLVWLAERLGRELPYDLLALLAVGLLAFHMYHVEWQVLTGGDPWDSAWVRNAWLDGFPFFALGAWFGRHRMRIQSLKPGPLRAGIALSVALALAEFSQVDVIDVLLGTTLLALLLMALALVRPEVRSPLLRRTACFCGRELTFIIYVLHVPLYGIAQVWQVPGLSWLVQRQWSAAPAVAVLSTLLAAAVYGVSRGVRAGKQKGATTR